MEITQGQAERGHCKERGDISNKNIEALRALNPSENAKIAGALTIEELRGVMKAPNAPTSLEKWLREKGVTTCL